MSRDRVFHLVTFVVAVSAVGLQFVLVVQGHHVLDETNRPPVGTRIVRFWSYLTIWGNVLLAGSALALGCGRVPVGRIGRALRLDAVVLIGVIAIVHFVLLRPLLDLHGPDLVADKMLHLVVPALGVLGWLVFGPRGVAGAGDILTSVLLPVLWLGYTLLRGAITDWYPYPFLDVTEHGYAVVLANCLGVALLLLGLTWGAVRLDARLNRESR